MCKNGSLLIGVQDALCCAARRSYLQLHGRMSVMKAPLASVEETARQKKLESRKSIGHLHTSMHLFGKCGKMEGDLKTMHVVKTTNHSRCWQALSPDGLA
jgi:hypothetical protein